MYVPSTRTIISSHDIVFYESFYSELAYKSQPYLEAMAMSPSVTYTPCATSLKEQTIDIIMFTQFEERGIFTITSNDAEGGEESDDKSNIPPLLSK